MKGGINNMTQKKKDYSKLSAVLAGGAIAVAAVSPGFYVSEPANGLTEEQVKSIVDNAVNGLNLSDADKVDYMYDKAFKEDSYEAYGEGLALAELDSKDSKRALMVALNKNGQNVESYRDIEDALVKEVTTEADGDDIKVVVEFKVDFFNDGDSDEDDAETARFFVDFVVADAANDDDEEREDAEAFADNFDLIKVYD